MRPSSSKWAEPGSSPKDLPEVDEVMSDHEPGRAVRVVPESLTTWDSSLPLFLLHLRSWCQARDAKVDLDELPAALKKLFQLVLESEEQEPAAHPSAPEEHPVRRTARRVASEVTDSVRFVGDCTIGAVEVPLDPRRFRWRALFEQMVEAGPKALPVVGMLSFMIGVTFAYETAQQLRDFGAQIYVINGIGLAVVRQIGPIIAAVVLAGRTGAAFAAHLGNMKLGGEIDALELLGVSPINYLVLPRLLALSLMMPLITLYADLLGILGGLLVTTSMLNIPATEFWVRLQNIVALTDINVGLVKSVFFGIVVALAGTLRGLQCERSAAGVGKATTSAVVTGITAIIIADALFAPIIDNLGF